MRLARIHAFALVLSLAGCAPALHVSAKTRMVSERLAFGRNVHGTEFVTDSLWAAFLHEVVEPRFPEGFTVWESRGQWRNPAGYTDRERGFMLEIDHPPSDEADRKIREIIAEYERRFNQEAVMRIVMPARVSF